MSSSIPFSEITVVMQGPAHVGFDVRYAAEPLRQLLPQAKIILSTQRAQIAPGNDYSIFDEVVLTQDPGELPPLKYRGPANNVNRQITSTRAGLERVTTPFAVKLRTDSQLTSLRFIEAWQMLGEVGDAPRRRGRSRILACSHFTLNPRYDERLAFHVSDLFAFGRTEDLLAFWQAPAYDLATAMWYDSHPHVQGSTRAEKAFRGRYAVEQWLLLHYLFAKDCFPILYHNHCSQEIVDDFEECLVDNFVIVHPRDLGLITPRHRQADNAYVNTICYSHEEWRALAKRKRDISSAFSGYTPWPRDELARKWVVRLRGLSTHGLVRRMPGRGVIRSLIPD